jgi:hypothetical protein
MNERGRRILEIISLVVIFSLLFGYPIYFLTLNNSLDIKHKTNRWAIFWDEDGSKIALEIENDSDWEEMQENWDEVRKKTDPEYHMYIYGKVVPYDNSWGFRLDPSTAVSFLSPIGAWSKSRNTIENIANNLNSTLSYTYAIYFKTIRFYNSEYAGVIPLIIDMILTGVVILLIGLHFYFKRERNMLTKIKEALLIAKEIPEGITLTELSQNVGLEQKRIERLISKNNLKGDLGLHITNDCIEFKEIIYKKRIRQVEEQLKDITQLTSDQITLEYFSKLAQFKNDLEEALVYYKDTSNIEQQMQIEIQLEVIIDLLESISLDAINK